MKCQLDRGSTDIEVCDLQCLMQDDNLRLLPGKAALKLDNGTLIKPKGECDRKAEYDRM